jgi:hypothetical protein
MKSVMLFTTRPITSRYTKSLIEQMSILQDYQNSGHDIIFVTPKTDPRNKKYIEEVAGITINKVISYKDHYVKKVRTKIYKNWYEYIEKENLFENEDLGDVKDIFIFGGLLSDATAITRKHNGMNRILNTWQQMNFDANGTYISGFFQLVKLSRERKIPFHEICYDPCENSISQLDYKPYKYTCYHGYDWPEYEFVRLDSMQKKLIEETDFFKEDPKKCIDLCFGFTALTSDREAQYTQLMDSLEKQPNIDIKLFVKHKSLNIDTFVDRNIYLDNISKARFTLIIPPYDLKHFSIYRFIESIHLDCLPLITNDVNVLDFAKSFDIDLNILGEITTGYSEIGKTIDEITENKRIEILTYFKNKCLKYEMKIRNFV